MKHKWFLKNNKLNNKPIAIILWVIFFCYSVCAALIFQKVLLSLIPSMHASGGLLPNDSAYFHSVAVNLAEQIRVYGWSAWKLFPTASASGNTAMLAALYRLFGYDPSLIIPINAAIHALGGLLVFYITREVATKNNVGTYAGIIAAILFITFPSSLNWYGQVHKDGYVIAGTLLVLLTWLKAINGQGSNRAWLLVILANLAGVFLVGSVRPYNLIFILLATLGALILLMILYAIRRQLLINIKTFIFFLISLMFISYAINLVVDLRVEQIAQANGVAGVAQTEAESYYKDWHSKKMWHWENSSWVPSRLEGYLATASRTRAALIEYGQSENAKSIIDENITPQNVTEMVHFLPRALQVAMFAPFPNSWFSHLSLTRLIATGEMLIYYIAISGVLLLIFNNRKPGVFICIYFAGFFLLIYGYTLANLGSLYRVRYAYIFVMLLLGVLGWVTWLEKTNRLRKLFDFLRSPLVKNDLINNLVEMDHRSHRKAALSSAILVMGLTFLCFLGLFLRDIFMAHKFGLTQTLDNFYVALIIPMFVATVFSIPIGTAFIPVYLDLKQRVKSNVISDLITKFSYWIAVVSLIICLILYSFGPHVLSILSLSKKLTDMADLAKLLHLALPLLLFSGFVVLGNAILNAHDRALLASGAQLVVPIAAIFALFVFGADYGVNAVMYGMVIGQILNLFIVQFALKRYRISLMPKLISFDRNQFSDFLKQYFPQVISALFIALAVPVATLLAMTLPAGAVSAFNLGSKIVLFITGLITTAMSAVILPYFSTLVVKNHIVAARRELSFFLLFSTLISIPVTFGMYVYSDHIVRLLFEGENFDGNAISQVVRVMQYSIVQLPFFVCNALLLKFAVASKHTFAICVVAIIGLLIAIGSSLLLMSHMGVAGIAFGTSIAMLLSTIILVLILVRYWHINYFDALILLLSWLLFITLLMCVHFKSVPSIYATTLAYIALVVAYLNSLKINNICEDGLLIEK
ncbi:MAG: lipid II flippase MurJ [Methylotenera sp.]